MNQLAHIHDYRMTALIWAADDKAWREQQTCVKCPWAVRWMKLPPTPPDEPPAEHRAPCWCPKCMNRKRR